MRAKIWGCRGSLAAPGADTVKYGGNTSCVEVRLNDDTLIVLDAGTGVRLLGMEDMPKIVHLFLTHLHLDHLEGFGFFSPLWRPDCELHVWGPSSPLKSLENRIEGYLSPPLFPVHVSEVPSQLTFHDAPDGEWQIGDATIFSQHISHSGPTIGYRITEGGQTFAYMPDHEPYRGGIVQADPAWLSGHAIAYGADLLMHDSQYTEEEYPTKVGWGHSSVDHVVEYARVAKVRKLLMFHHDPLHTDAQLDAHLVRAHELLGDGETDIALAREGMDIDFSA